MKQNKHKKLMQPRRMSEVLVMKNYKLFLLICVLSNLIVPIKSYAQVKGYIDRVSVKQGKAFVQGWACDFKVKKSISVHLYVEDSRGHQTYLAGGAAWLKNEIAVNRACETSAGVKHRFNIQISANKLHVHKGKKINVYGISTKKQKNLKLKNSGKFRVPRIYEKTYTRNLIKDSGFKKGFILNKSLKSSEKKRLVNIPLPCKFRDCRNAPPKPDWSILQWNSKLSLNPSKAFIYKDEYILENDYKSIGVNPSKGEVIFSINGLDEYRSRYRRPNGPWPHLLLQQRISRPYDVKGQSASIYNMRELRLKMTAQLLEEQRNISRGYSKNHHAQQFLLFFTVQNLNRKSNEFGKYIWFGVPLYDDRHLFVSQGAHIDRGTSSLLYHVSMRNYSNISTHSKRAINIDKDILPEIKNALHYAFKRGVLKSKNLNDYKIGGMNMGFETTGLNVTTFKIKNLMLIQKAITK